MKNKNDLLLSVLIYLINPLIGIFVLCFAILKKKDAALGSYYILITMLSLYMGLINSTKEITGDLTGYKIGFERAAILSIIDFLKEAGKEPVYYFISYISYYLLNGDFRLYLLLVTFIGYFLVLISLLNLWKFYKVDEFVIIGSFVLYVFCEWYFSFSSQLLRQGLAQGFVFAFLVQNLTNKKYVWSLGLISVLIHSSAIMFIGLVVLMNLIRSAVGGEDNKKYTKSIIKTIVIIIVYYYTSKLVMIIFGDYLFNRISDQNFKDQSNIVAIEYFILYITIGIVMLIIGIIGLLTNKVNKNKKWFVFVYILYCVFITNLIIIDENLLAYRFIIYGFMFYPVIMYIPIVMYRENYRFISVLKFIYSILLVIIVIRFYRFFSIGSSSMPMPLLSVQDLLLYPVFFYFI